ncbi:MAG: phosphotransferase [Oscillospiraceae bacterium]|nr:phosphotransferase [Oscillospiraceae bacterium]
MLDLHCHILPGVDDGASDPEISLRMAAVAADCGVRHIFATPHCNTRSQQKNFRDRRLIGAFRALQTMLDEAGIPVTILAGAEVLARGHFEEHLAAGDFMTLNGSRYLLLEFYFDEEPDYMEDCLRAVERRGLTPVVAHPERYFCVQRSPELAQRWAEGGRVLQLNKGSLLGELGPEAFETAALLLRRGAVSVLASDAHHFLRRSPDMLPLLDCLARRFPEADPELLLRVNPLRIAKDQDL